MFLLKNHKEKILLALLAFLPGYASSSTQGWGTVGITGTIVDTACTIAAGSEIQTVDMGILSVGQILREGQGVAKPFSIELVNCILERSGNKNDWKFFQVTFDGHAEDALFGLQGDARGIALKIKDTNGLSITPGKPLPLEEVTQGNKVLNYSMILMPNQHPLKAGAYFGTVRFKLDYF
ncbi:MULTISPECIES: fimbrial protein [Serratia]|uniref:fimbrial protein n=1 Tax=Serratia TaxID=613 RepID=UPI0008A972DD|nr:fimbrial protein [Serratia marcescens]APS37041.1 pilin [Serratia marcescens]OHT35979.1 pilin [Serratia marcescens]OHT38036.1 pilin [Serratia marcescens]